MPPRAVLLYDGACGVCAAAARGLARWDLTRRLTLTDFRAENPARLPGGLTLAQCEARLQLVEANGRTSAGFYALRRLSALLPALWWAAPILHVPGARLMLEPAYEAFARARFALSERLAGFR